MNYDYSKGIYYYEEIHWHLARGNRNNKVYGMGMELILKYGLKFFFNKFKRKGAFLDHYDISKEPAEWSSSCINISDSSQELILLLSEMIQAGR